MITQNKYNVQKLEEKLNRYKNMKLVDVLLNDIDEICSIK